MTDSLSFRSNANANRIANNLNKTSQDLATNYERLSSGLRINGPADDAAGLALASRLSTDARVYTQSIKNVNHGISLINIAAEAVDALNAVTMRQAELANQAANGTLSRTQRVALDEEANTLVDEFNRIVQAAEYNDVKLLDNTFGTSSLQAGYGSNGSISFSLASDLARTYGTGTFQTMVSSAAGSTLYGISAGDLDNDGDNDVVSASFGTSKIDVLLNNGNGTFQTVVTYATGGALTPTGISLGDLDNDGNLDIAFTNYIGGAGSSIGILFGNGNGTFEAAITYSTGSGTNPFTITAGDFNGDGYKDLAVADLAVDKVGIFINNGNGTFAAQVTYTVGDQPYDVQTGDFNNDGYLDLVTSNTGTSDNLSVLLGNGNGTFQAQKTISPATAGADQRAVALTDLNHDGYLDMVSAASSSLTLQVFLGNGNGTFQTSVSYAMDSATSWTNGVTAEDVNGDGHKDLIGVGGTNPVNVLLNNGNGTFATRITYGTGTGTPWKSVVADFTGDGAMDIVTNNQGTGTIGLFKSNTTSNTTIADLNLTTQQTAQEAITTIASTQLRVDREKGRIAAYASRFEHTVSLLRNQRENLDEAVNRITSVDVASETASLIKNQILQDSQTALFAQANNLPSNLIKMLLDED